ncbi:MULTISPECIES: TrmB family transcriptional regulator [unclassified Haloferax]|uniref:TrmB family transcriptional regulator n=1 Tax=Haloferax TaxID=2251 RepID=UPI0002B1C5BF|nr:MULTISPECIES: helix-turn-helix domain-containing protein [unclassified Haloferax]ELZ59052.1 transcriptional regulator [Haloferax sp. ATCC BAA-646]ELZ60343.1 transcriptional regulator [Haloferax sp. ATCC BAA-645]ELZ72346.1 transcriptional regulator [Haloferax sp. ATCC BAA-644]
MASLCDLGLSSYEERVYTALLELRNGTAEEIADQSDVPMGRIYDVLNSLESRKLVRREPNSRPREYSPVDPELVVSRLLEEQKQELEVKQAQLESTATDLLAQIGQKAPIDGRFWIADEDARSLFDGLANRANRVTDEWAMTWTASAGGLFGLEETSDEIWSYFGDILEKEIQFKILMTPQLVDTLPSEFVDDISTSVDKYPNFEVRVSERVYNSLDIIDQTNLAVYVADPFDPRSILGITQIDDPEFTKLVKSSFIEYWNEADQFNF